MKRALLFAIIPALMLQQGAPTTAQAPDALGFFKNYFITGDYVVGGTSLWRQGVDGVATEDIVMSGVPAGVDILAAFLYVQTTEVAQWSGIDHARFDGYDLGPGSSSIAKALNWDLATAPCWSVGGPASRRLVTYRADVLRFLPVGEDGKPFVNRAHTVVVPDYGIAWPDGDESVVEGGGPTGPRAIGASLVLIYRDPTAPYRGIVIDDGGITKPAFATMNHTIKGFYQASTSPAAKMTHIVGDGRPYLSERYGSAEA